MGRVHGEPQPTATTHTPKRQAVVWLSCFEYYTVWGWGRGRGTSDAPCPLQPALFSECQSAVLKFCGLETTTVIFKFSGIALTKKGAGLAALLAPKWTPVRCGCAVVLHVVWW
jgi:hypothetical protein